MIDITNIKTSQVQILNFAYNKFRNYEDTIINKSKIEEKYFKHIYYIKKYCITRSELLDHLEIKSTSAYYDLLALVNKKLLGLLPEIITPAYYYITEMGRSLCLLMNNRINNKVWVICSNNEKIKKIKPGPDYYPRILINGPNHCQNCKTEFKPGISKTYDSSLHFIKKHKAFLCLKCKLMFNPPNLEK